RATVLFPDPTGPSIAMMSFVMRAPREWHKVESRTLKVERAGSAVEGRSPIVQIPNPPGVLSSPVTSHESLCSLKRLLNFPQRITQYHRPPVRAAHRTFRLRQLREQPLHPRRIERRVHLDGRMAGRRCRDFGLQRLDGNRLVLALHRVQDF